MLESNLHIIYKWHYNNARGVMTIQKTSEPVFVVEKMQEWQRKYGRPDGITWKLFEGSFPRALVETTRI